MTWNVWEGLELRQSGRKLSGSFPYGKTATLRDRGRVRKEKLQPSAFRYAVEDDEHEVDLLVGHSFDMPLASKQRGTLKLKDSAKSLDFEAELPPEGDQPQYIVDTLKGIRSGLVRGLSPAFRIPPRGVVRDAETLVPEVGNPGVYVREVNDAVIFEMSVVSRPYYTDTTLDVRSERELERELDDLELYRLLL